MLLLHLRYVEPGPRPGSAIQVDSGRQTPYIAGNGLSKGSFWCRRILDREGATGYSGSEAESRRLGLGYTPPAFGGVNSESRLQALRFDLRQATAYVTGNTRSVDFFPTVPQPLQKPTYEQPTAIFSGDAFPYQVCRPSWAWKGVPAFCTPHYLRWEADDIGYSSPSTFSGSAYVVAGNTKSTNFPTVQPARRSANPPYGAVPGAAASSSDRSVVLPL